MATVFKTEYKKEIAFIELFISEMPEFKNTSANDKKKMRRDAARGWYNTEKMMEEFLCDIQPELKNVNNKGMDYTSSIPELDKSDLKTSTASYRLRKRKKYTYEAYIGSINGVKGKLGALLVAIYNEYKDSIDYFYIPHDAYQGENPDLRVSFSNYPKGKINYSYSVRNESYGTIEKYRVADIYEMVFMQKLSAKKNKSNKLHLAA
jgi:hypothetical protein